jgi:hypothetical protein
MIGDDAVEKRSTAPQLLECLEDIRCMQVIITGENARALADIRCTWLCGCDDLFDVVREILDHLKSHIQPDNSSQQLHVPAQVARQESCSMQNPKKHHSALTADATAAISARCCLLLQSPGVTTQSKG